MSTSSLDITSTIYRGRHAMNAHPALFEALHTLLKAVGDVPNPDRTHFLEYVRLVYGTTNSISLPVDGPPQVIARPRLVDLDELREDPT